MFFCTLEPKYNVLVGRIREIKLLRRYKQSSRSEFIAVYGRRRVGKTYLIREVFPRFDFHLTGIAEASMSEQLLQFHLALARHFPSQSTVFDKPPSDWIVAFDRLRTVIEQQRESKEKKVIFFDELPWLDTMHSNFISGLEHFWNHWAHHRGDILLIACGSAASWMIKHLLQSRTGLHNRITGQINLQPFTLSEVKEFLKHKNFVLDDYQIISLYMVFGGIPYYLELLSNQESATQNVDNLCFSTYAPLRKEFENLYASLFHKHDRHLEIVRALATSRKGLSRSEIVNSTKLTNGGGLTRILHELEESAFLRSYRAVGKKSRDILYQLIDNFSLFHLEWIQNAGTNNDHFWINQLDTPKFYSWAGFAFERVCMMHIPEIKRALGIDGIQTSVSSWQSSKAQIDILIDRKDHVINICEMKYSLHPFKITKSYSENLRKKMSQFKQVTSTKKSLFLTFITTYGLGPSPYSGMVQNDLTMDVLFENVRN